jgi:myo-inositol-1(or 4)-monophosphatase
MPESLPYPEDLALIVATAREAAGLIQASCGRIEREMKTSAGAAIPGWKPEEAVTEADRASQRLIIARLRARFPDDGFIGEENDDAPGITMQPARRGSRFWVIDPIDGTNNFVAGLGCYCVCIGLLDRGYPVLGVVHDVARNLTYAAADGQSWINAQPVRALTTPLSDRSLIMLTCNLLDQRAQVPGFIGQWLAHSSWKLRMLGSAALEAVQVGAGVAHGAITVNSKLWDISAAAAIILASGGRVTDFRGRDVFPFDTTAYQGAKVPFLAAAPQAHGDLLAQIEMFGWPRQSSIENDSQ